MAISRIISDDELIIKVRQGNNEAGLELFTRYEHYAWRIAHDFNSAYPNSGIDINDYHQVAFACIPGALKFYDLEFGSFYQYWKKFSWNELITYFKRNSYICNPSPVGDDGSWGVLSEDDFGKPDYTLTDKLEMDEIEYIIQEIIDKTKNEKDRLIINLFLKETNFEEIHKIVKVPLRKIYYVIAKFKRSFTNLYEKW